MGGGIIGASVAYHLAARGMRDVLVLDRGERPGDGSTGRATGGFRVQFASPIDVRLSLLSLQKLLRFADEIGGDCGYVPAGYLWLASSDDELAALRAALAVQRANGVTNARDVAVDDIAALNPAVSRDGVIGGTYCSTDGFIAPLRMLDGYRGAAERLGVRFEDGADVVGFDGAAGGRITAVRTASDCIATELVVNAAGPWAARVANLARAELPVTPLRRHIAATEPTNVLPPMMPMTIFCTDGFHLRVRDGRVLLLLPTPGAADPFDDSVDASWLDLVAGVARRRVPALANVAVDPATCRAGLYEMSPDGHAILGPSPDVPNLFFANGSSGHGVMHAPALGQLAAEIIAGDRPSLDVAALSPERFRRPNAGGETAMMRL